MRDRTDLVWRGFALHLGEQIEPLLTVVPDDRSGLFRIRFCDGHLSDTVNLSRAKDAALSIALAHANLKGSIQPADPPPMRLPRQGLSDQGAARFERVIARGQS